MESASRDPIASRGSLLALPAELAIHILALLEPLDLARVALSCRHLYTQSSDDLIWRTRVNAHLPFPISTSAPASSFRALYLAHHPNWYLTERRIWFGDSDPSGKLLVARYNEVTGSIEAYTVVASALRGSKPLELWEKDPNVIIHNFEPRVSLDLHQPVLKLDIDSPKVEDPPNDHPSDRAYAPKSAYSKEVLMGTFADAGIYSSFMLCRILPDVAMHHSEAVWPPLRFPAPSRTRNESSDGFNSTGHRPTRFSEVSQNNFRLRKWVEYSGRRASPSTMPFGSASSLTAALGVGMPYFASGLNSVGGGMSIRMPESITTYSTLPDSCYAPTPKKPWQGIWCGDYSGHGCEFLVIRQPDIGHEAPLPQGMDWLEQWFAGGRRGSASSNASFVSAVEQLDPTVAAAAESSAAGSEQQDWPNHTEEVLQGFVERPYERTLTDITDYDDVPSGRIEAIKLTGDPNIPRGEYTFIAPDIGHAGFMRVADESPFQGARIVRSAGHIAGRGFRHDQYTPSQLIMISHDRLAQFWEGFGHISYYQRVDLDALTKYQQ